MDARRRQATLAAALALVTGAAVGRALLDSMNDSDPSVLSALAGAADAGAEAPVAAPSYHLVLVVLDGLGEDAFLRAIDATSLRAYDWSAAVDVGSPSLSRPVYHVLLTGVPAAVSGIRNNAHRGPARADDLAARVREAGGTVGWALETVPWFHDLFGRPGDALERAGEEPVLHSVTDRFDAIAGPERDLAGVMKRILSAEPTLAVLHASCVDHAGHHHGGASEAYRRAAETTAAAVAALREEQTRSGRGARTVWMIGADHGHLLQGGHGGPEREVRRTKWIGLWPAGAVARRVDIAGEVPAERLAATFAAVLGVPAPREALGDPLELPDRPARSSAESAVRRASVERALAAEEEEAHRGLAARAVALVAALGILVAALVRRGKRGRALFGAALPALCACAMFALLGPGLTLSAIRTHASFLARSIGVMALGAAPAFAAGRRWGSPPAWSFVIAGLVPAAAFAVTAGSLGRSALPPSLWLILPATGLLPWGVGLGAAVAQSAQWLLSRLRNPAARSRI